MEVKPVILGSLQTNFLSQPNRCQYSSRALTVHPTEHVLPKPLCISSKNRRSLIFFFPLKLVLSSLTTVGLQTPGNQCSLLIDPPRCRSEASPLQ